MADEDIWDEEQWEAFLRKDDERVNRYMNHLVTFLTTHPMPDPDDAGAMTRWEARLRRYLIERGWYPEDIEQAFSGEESAAAPPPGHAPWDDTLDDGDGMREELLLVPAYRQASQLASTVLRWSDEIPGAQKDSALVQFCTHAVQIPTNIARGHGLGFDRETIGGYIACVKRALASANAALELLPDLKARPYMQEALYRSLYERLFETRNEAGVYVQELRRRFELGIE